MYYFSIVSDHLCVANGGIELSFDLHYVHVLTSVHHQKSRLPSERQAAYGPYLQRKDPPMLSLDRPVPDLSERANIRPW